MTPEQITLYSHLRVAFVGTDTTIRTSYDAARLGYEVEVVGQRPNDRGDVRYALGFIDRFALIEHPEDHRLVAREMRLSFDNAGLAESRRTR